MTFSKENREYQICFLVFNYSPDYGDTSNPRKQYELLGCSGANGKA